MTDILLNGLLNHHLGVLRALQHSWHLRLRRRRFRIVLWLVVSPEGVWSTCAFYGVRVVIVKLCLILIINNLWDGLY